jgi:RNA polymerase sigma-70 factor (ECF subfamily)
VLGALGRAGVTGRREALGNLLVRYLPALRLHVQRRAGVDGHAAEDLVQSFIADKLLSESFLAGADKQRGRFRTYLLTALDRFAISEHRRQSAQKRRPRDGRVVAIDGAVEQPAPRRGAADAFDAEWARQIVTQAVSRMREECERRRRDDLWALFELRIMRPAMEGTPAPSYAELAERFSFASPKQACIALRTVQRLFTRALYEVVGEYAGSVEMVDAELLDLRRILSRMPVACETETRRGANP